MRLAEPEMPGLPPIAGFFGGSIERFKEVAQRYDSELLNRLNWF